MCAGPYRFVERVANDHITLEKFPDYWDKSRVHIDRIIYRVIPDSTVRLANLRSGALDLIEQMSLARLRALQGDPRLKVVQVMSLGYMPDLHQCREERSRQYAARPRCPHPRKRSTSRSTAMS